MNGTLPLFIPVEDMPKGTENLFIPVEKGSFAETDYKPSGSFDVRTTPEYSITQKALGVIPFLQRGAQMATYGLETPDIEGYEQTPYGEEQQQYERLSDIAEAQKQASEAKQKENIAAWQAYPFIGPLSALQKAGAIGGAVYRDLRTGRSPTSWEATRAELAGRPLEKETEISAPAQMIQETVESSPDIAFAMVAQRAGIPIPTTFGMLAWLKALRENKTIPEAAKDAAINAAIPKGMEAGTTAIKPLAKSIAGISPILSRAASAAGATAGAGLTMGLPEAGDIAFGPDRAKQLASLGGRTLGMGLMTLPGVFAKEKPTKVSEAKPTEVPKTEPISEATTVTNAKGLTLPESEMQKLRDTYPNNKGLVRYVKADGETQIVFDTGQDAPSYGDKRFEGRRWLVGVDEFQGKPQRQEIYLRKETGDRIEPLTKGQPTLSSYKTQDDVANADPSNFIDQLSKSNPEESLAWFNTFAGKYSTPVMRVGEKLRTPEGIEQVRKAYEKAKAESESINTKAQELKAKGDFNGYIAELSKRQGPEYKVHAFQEMLESAESNPKALRWLEEHKTSAATIPPVEQPKTTAPAPTIQFKTSKGSVYEVNSDGTTTRNKAARTEHPGEEGLQPKSKKTWYVTDEEANVLSEVQAQGGAMSTIAETPDGKIGVKYLSGKDKGKFERRTMVSPKTEPSVGLIPVEFFGEDKTIHFGNKITDINKIPTEAPKPTVPTSTPATARIETKPTISEMPELSPDLAKRLADRLEKLKLGTSSGELAGGLYGVTKLVWNGAIDVAQGILKAGGKMAEAIEAAVKYIKERHKGEWDEEGFRASFAEVHKTVESKPAIESLRQKLADSVSKVSAYREYLRGQQRAGLLATEATKKQLKEADDWLEADARNIGQSLSQLVREVLPKSEQGRYLTRITQAMKRPSILSKDPGVMYDRASKLASEIENYADRYQEINQRNTVMDDIRKSVQTAMDSPNVDTNYKNKIQELVKGLRLAKTSPEKLRQLVSRQQFVDRMKAEGKDNPIPEQYMQELDLLKQTDPKDLPVDVLQAMHDRIQLLTQLGRKAVKGRVEAFNAERDAMTSNIQSSKSTALNDIPTQRTPGIRLPFTQRLGQALGNKFKSAVNAGLKVGRALYQRDVMLDIMDGDANYQGGLTRTFGWSLDKAYNRSMNLKDEWLSPLRDIVRKHNFDKTSAERISIYAISREENGVKRLMESGVTPETIAHINRTITPGEREFYNSTRTLFDEVIYPQLKDFMRENYNIDVGKVENYWPFQRDWSQFEGKAKPTAGEQIPVGPAGEQVGFDELASWRALQENWNPRTTTARKGMTIERVPQAEGAIRLNALDVVDQHIAQVAHLLGQQRDLRMLGQIAREDWFKEKYGNLGQQYVLNLLDTVARNGDPSGASRILALDALRRNTSVGIIGLRLLSQMKHAPNWAFTLAEVKPKFIKDGMTAALTDEGKQFLKQNFAEVFQRFGGEPAIAEIGGKGWWKQIQKHSFFLERAIDAIHARTTVLGAYMEGLAKKGLDPSRYAELPLDPESARNALIVSRKGVTSPLVKDLPQGISRGALTGGNVSLGRAIFQFQNTMLRQWGFMKHDIFDLNIKKFHPDKAAVLMLAFASMLAAETLIVESNKLLLEKMAQSLYDPPAHKPTRQEIEEENESTGVKFGKNMAVELFRRVPFAGNVVSMAKYKQLGVPVIDSAIDVANTGYSMMEAKTERGRERAIARGLGTVGTLGGIPGAATAEQIYLKGHPPRRNPQSY